MRINGRFRKSGVLIEPHFGLLDQSIERAIPKHDRAIVRSRSGPRSMRRPRITPDIEQVTEVGANLDRECQLQRSMAVVSEGELNRERTVQKDSLFEQKLLR